MAEDITFTNTYMCYWKNLPYHYPNWSLEQRNQIQATGEINTGWHIIPTMLWRHFTTPKQWTHFMIDFEAYTVKGYTVTIYNPIPMTQQLAIQGTTAFTAFNNTIYTIGAQDDLYETGYHHWLNEESGDFKYFNLAFKEGQYRNATGTYKKTIFPTYLWRTANPRNVSNSTYSWLLDIDSYSTWPRVQGQTYIPNGIFWDPLTDPDHIMELRPGKNAMSFSWNVHDCDANKWFNLDQLAKWYPYMHDTPFSQSGMPGPTGSYQISKEDDPDPLTSESSWTKAVSDANFNKLDYTIPNLQNLPIVPMAWFWQEMQKSIAEIQDTRKPAMWWAGTEYESFKYPPTQCFLKGIPLFDDNDTHVETLTQGCCRVSLYLQGKKRRSRIFAPTWGPFSWRQVYAMDAPRAPSMVRYRTGGARRTWTNIDKNAGDPSYNHREDPFLETTYASARSTTSIIYAKPAFPNMPYMTPDRSGPRRGDRGRRHPRNDVSIPDTVMEATSEEEGEVTA
uniref:Capsid protein VP1 n=1 Tax=Hedgehog chapparvovirus TaxID=3072828 RepID=A0AA51N249_9VIRU|nr:capsid protein VP1 [Hedgehog chapparvovirus]